jgi:putative transposase
MPRRARLLAAEYRMHVIVRGIDRRALFFAGNDYRFFLASLGAAAKSEGVAVHVYVLMTAEEDRGGSAVMKRLGQRW